MNDPEFTVYVHGLVAASVCTSLPLDEATARLNRELPTGIKSQWSPATDARFADGSPQPGPCERSTNTHYLFYC